VLTDKKVIDFFTNEMVLAKINGKEDSLLKKEHHVSAFPTLVMLDKDGQEVDRVVGYRNPDEFLTTLRNYRNGIGTLADLLHQAESDSDRTLAYEIGEKYKYRGGSKEAEVWFKKVIENGNSRDSLSGEARMEVADMYRRAEEYDRALDAFKSITEDFRNTELGDDAELWVGVVYRQKGDTANAINAYKGFLERHPESDDIDWVQRQITKLEGKPETKKE
jgi:tetratricopeptide (TPR) repeat protein